MDDQTDCPVTNIKYQILNMLKFNNLVFKYNIKFWSIRQKPQITELTFQYHSQ